MKQQIMIYALLFVLIVGFAQAEVVYSPEQGDFPDTITAVDGVFRSTAKPLNFVNVQTDSISSEYDLVGRSITYQWNGQNNDVGIACQVGQYIAFKFDNHPFYQSNYIFGEFWYVASSGDYPRFGNYYTKDIDGGFNYRYACYESAVSDSVVDDFEKGCLTYDKTACVQASSPSCGTEYTFQYECLKHIDTSDASGADDSQASSDTSTSSGDDDSGVVAPIVSDSSGNTRPAILSYSNLRIRESDGKQDGKLVVGDTLYVIADVYAPVAGEYFVEAGTWSKDGLAFVQINQNTCDPSELWYNNQRVTLPQGGSTIEFALLPKAGETVYWVAQVEGCGGAGLTELKSPTTVMVYATQEAHDAALAGSSSDGVPSGDGSAGGGFDTSFSLSNGLLIALALIGAGLFLSRNKKRRRRR